MSLFKLITRLFTRSDSQNAEEQTEFHALANTNEEEHFNSIQRQLQEMAAKAREERLSNIQSQLKDMAAIIQEDSAAKQYSSQAFAFENYREKSQYDGFADRHQGAGSSLAYLRRDDDDTLINPATGLLMVGGIAGFDAMGNTFGTSGCNDMLAGINTVNGLTDINPANGLPMVGDVDVMGNPYGTDTYQDNHSDFGTDSYHDHHTDYGGSDFGSGSFGSDW